MLKLKFIYRFYIFICVMLVHKVLSQDVYFPDSNEDTK